MLGFSNLKGSINSQKASNVITILTEDDLPATAIRTLRKALTGSALSKSEKRDGSQVASIVRQEADFWAGSLREQDGDYQFVSLPKDILAVHFAVKNILGR